MPGQACAQNRFKTFNPILKILRDLQKGTLGHGSRQGNDDDREFREVKLTDGIGVAAFGKFCLRIAHAVAHIGNDFGLIPPKFELQNHIGIAIHGRGGQFFEPVQIRQFRFHGLDEKFLTVLGGNALEGHGNDQGGDFNIRLAFLGQNRIGQGAHGQGQDNEGQNHARAGDGPIDQTGHCAASV